MEREVFDAVLEELSQRGCPVNTHEVVARLAERGIVVTVDDVEEYCRNRERQKGDAWKVEQGMAHTAGGRKAAPLPWWTPEHHGE